MLFPYLYISIFMLSAVQDKGLDTLYDVVVRQKHMAQNIGQEIDLQNGLYLFLYFDLLGELSR